MQAARERIEFGLRMNQPLFEEISKYKPEEYEKILDELQPPFEKILTRQGVLGIDKTIGKNAIEGLRGSAAVRIARFALLASRKPKAFSTMLMTPSDMPIARLVSVCCGDRRSLAITPSNESAVHEVRFYRAIDRLENATDFELDVYEAFGEHIFGFLDLASQQRIQSLGKSQGKKLWREIFAVVMAEQEVLYLTSIRQTFSGGDPNFKSQFNEFVKIAIDVRERVRAGKMIS